MTKNGTKSREIQRTAALLTLVFAELIACGQAAPAPTDTAQTGAPASATETSSAAAGAVAAAPTQTPSTSTPASSAQTAAAPAMSATAAMPAKAMMMAAPASSAMSAAAGGGAGNPASQSPDATPAMMASGSAGTTGGASGAPAGSSETAHEDLGKGDGTDVIAIGDSWMNLGATGIQQSLVRLSMQPYRVYGVPGTRLLDGVIPSQYTSAKRANPDIKTVVMTGGGNDILLTGAGVDRSTAGPATMMQIDMIGEGLVELWTEMGADGVKDIVYIEYSRGGQSEAAVNYATEKLKPLCDNNQPARCHWIDSDDFLMKMLSGDGIHPTGAGCDKIATGVIALMEERGLRR
jgi:hypothetical protein